MLNLQTTHGAYAHESRAAEFEILVVVKPHVKHSYVIAVMYKGACNVQERKRNLRIGSFIVARKNEENLFAVAFNRLRNRMTLKNTQEGAPYSTSLVRLLCLQRLQIVIYPFDISAADVNFGGFLYFSH